MMPSCLRLNPALTSSRCVSGLRAQLSPPSCRNYTSSTPQNLSQHGRRVAIQESRILGTQSAVSRREVNTFGTPTRIGESRKAFSTSPPRCVKTVQQLRSKNRSGPFSWKAGLLFFLTGGGLILYFRYEKERMVRKRIAEQNKGIGKPLVGGKFELIDSEGKEFTEQNLKGKYSLIYFGFTHCPDICPDELDKMAKMIDIVKERAGNILKPVFISCDPWRDSPEVVKRYLAEFHPDIVGLTGEYQNVKDTCKVYRVYFSTPPQLKPGQDYIVDHSIYFYLMDPEGDFVEAIGRERTAEEGASAILGFAKDWQGKIDKS